MGMLEKPARAGESGAVGVCLGDKPPPAREIALLDLDADDRDALPAGRPSGVEAIAPDQTMLATAQIAAAHKDRPGIAAVNNLAHGPPWGSESCRRRIVG